MWEKYENVGSDQNSINTAKPAKPAVEVHVGDK
jgi:hypothetical protein